MREPQRKRVDCLRVAFALTMAALMFSGPAVAAGWYSGSIAQVELTSIGEITVFLVAPANHECGSKRLDYVTPNDAPGRAMLAALLAWQAQDKPIRAYIANCNGTIALFNTVMND